MINYLIGYACFLLGAIIYLLSKVKDFKEMADANKDPKVLFSFKKMLSTEWINLAQLLLGGIALVAFMPTLINGQTVEFMNSQGMKVGAIPLKQALSPFYFLIGWSGNSALFALFGKYKKTLLNQVGVDDK